MVKALLLLSLFPLLVACQPLDDHAGLLKNGAVAATEGPAPVDVVSALRGLADARKQTSAGHASLHSLRTSAIQKLEKVHSQQEVINNQSTYLTEQANNLFANSRTISARKAEALALADQAQTSLDELASSEQALSAKLKALNGSKKQFLVLKLSLKSKQDALKRREASLDSRDDLVEKKQAVARSQLTTIAAAQAAALKAAKNHDKEAERLDKLGRSIVALEKKVAVKASVLKSAEQQLAKKASVAESLMSSSSRKLSQAKLALAKASSNFVSLNTQAQQLGLRSGAFAKAASALKAKELSVKKELSQVTSGEEVSTGGALN